MAKAIDWTGITVRALEAYAYGQGWTRDAKGSKHWSFTTNTTTSRNIRMAIIEAEPLGGMGDLVRQLRLNREPLAEIAERLRKWSVNLAAREQGA